ncbi:MAG TPA: hypothetical protein V6C57_26670 [Coleofasciculaceae cyanobacterium]
MKKRKKLLNKRTRLLIMGMSLSISLIGLLTFSIGLLTTSKATAQPITPWASDTFVDSVGIVAHLSYTDTPYAQNWGKADPSQDIRAIFADLGIRHVRDGIAHPTLQPSIAYQRSRLAQLYRDEGIQLITVSDVRKNGILDASQIGTYLDEYANGAIDLDGETFKVRDLLEAIEGPNEYDQSNHADKRDPNWVKSLKNYQSELYSQVKSNPLLSNLPVVMPSLIYTKHCTDKLGALTGTIDYGNLHLYPNYPYFLIPTGNFRWHFSNGQNCFKDKPVYITETGYQTGGGGISDRTIAKYLSRLLPEFFLRPQIKRTYLYSLIDISPESGHWGLVRPERNGQKIAGYEQFTLTPKLSYHAVKSLLDLLREGKWVKAERKWAIPPVNPKPVEILFEGKQDSTHHLLLQKSTGDYFLLLWQEVEAFNPTAGNFEPPVDEVSVSLPKEYKLQTLYKYNDSFKLEPIALSENHQMTIQVPDSVVVLHFIPQE